MIPTSARESGQSNGETIVFLHGGGIGPWMRDQHRAALTEYHCLAPPLPGHRGGSPELFAFETAVEQVAALIRTRAKGGRAHLVGLSLGAQLAVLVVARHPELIGRAVITGTNVTGLPALPLMHPLFVLADPLRGLAAMQRATMKRFHVPGDAAEEFRADSRVSVPRVSTSIVTASGRFGVPDGLDRFPGQMLITFGEKEVQKVYTSAERIAAAVPDSAIYVAEALNHVWPLEDPQRFSDTVRAWLQERPLPNGMRQLAPTGLKKRAVRASM